MEAERVIQGRRITPGDVGLIRDLLAANPSWNRSQLSRELCARWAWRNGKGRLKDMACRTLLLKLERLGQIQLPPRQTGRPNARGFDLMVEMAHDRSPIEGLLSSLQPLSIEALGRGDRRLRLFKFLLHRYHYLGHRTCVGENLKVLASDSQGRLLACVLFGSAAWKVKSRDAFIGWEPQVRERNLSLLTNNPLSDLALGPRTASGQSSARGGLPEGFRPLDGDLRPSDSPARDLCRARSLPGHLLPGCGLEACRHHLRAQPE